MPVATPPPIGRPALVVAFIAALGFGSIPSADAQARFEPVVSAASRIADVAGGRVLLEDDIDVHVFDLIVYDRATGTRRRARRLVSLPMTIHFEVGALGPTGEVATSEFVKFNGGFFVWRDEVLIYSEGGFVLSSPQLSTSGDFAAWYGQDAAKLRTRRFSTGAIVDIAVPPASFPNDNSLTAYDLAPTGDAVIEYCTTSATSSCASRSALWYRAATTQTIAIPSQTDQMAARTDGVNLVYRSSGQILRYRDSGPEVLSSDITVTPAYSLAGGWIAFLQKDVGGIEQVWVRSPAGVLTKLSSATTSTRVEVVNTLGEVMFTAGGRRYFAAPQRAALDVGAASGTVRADGAEWFVIDGPTLYRVNTDVVPAPPTVASVTPTSGPTAGGTAVTIGGANFRVGATVSIGGVAATNVVVVNGTSITAVTGAHAAGAVSVTVTNADATSHTLASAYTYLAPPSQAPTIGAIANQITNEDLPLAGVAFTVADADTAAASLSVTAVSSNQTLVSDVGLVVSGSGGARTLAITPAHNANGTTTITLTVSDGALTGTASFTLTVTAVNDAPTISPLPAQAGVAGRLVGPLGFTINDVDSDVGSLGLSSTSSNAAVVPPAALSIGGSALSRTLTAQTANGSGVAVITLTVSDGAASTPTSFEIASTHTAPLALSATVQGLLVSLSWTAPSAGGPVAGYRVELGPAPGATTVMLDGGATPALATTALAAGTWFARVRALGPVGFGPASTEVSFTLSLVPSAPRNFGALVSNATVTFTWEPPLAGVVTGYAIELGNAPGAANLAEHRVGVVTTFSMSGPFGTYFARVKALDGASAGPASNEVSFTTAPGAGTPGAPQNLHVSVSGSAIAIAWSAPLTGAPPTGYILAAGSAAGLSDIAILPLAGTSLSVAAVPNGTYFVRVFATNGLNTGPTSNEVSFTVGAGVPLLPPGNPGNLIAAVSGNTVTISWSAPTSGGAVERYILQAGTASGLSNIGAFGVGAATSFSISGIASGTYFVRVAASNAAGPSPGTSNEVVVVVP